MKVHEGDGSPWSDLCASLLVREAREFGARWHGCSWTTHLILGADPWHAPRLQDVDEFDHWPSSDERRRSWTGNRPADWRPAVRMMDDSVNVTFYSFSGLGGERIIRHADSCVRPSYQCEFADTNIATGPGGSIP